MVKDRGWVAPEEVDNFINAGFSKAQVLEVILAISFKTLSNYINHISGTPLDDAFSAKAWQPVDKQTDKVA